jgi:hypothetical protein
VSLPGLFDDIENGSRLGQMVFRNAEAIGAALPGCDWYDCRQHFVRFRPVEHEYDFPHFLDLAISINSGRVLEFVYVFGFVFGQRRHPSLGLRSVLGTTRPRTASGRNKRLWRFTFVA